MHDRSSRAEKNDDMHFETLASEYISDLSGGKRLCRKWTFCRPARDVFGTRTPGYREFESVENEKTTTKLSSLSKKSHNSLFFFNAPVSKSLHVFSKPFGDHRDNWCTREREKR